MPELTSSRLSEEFPGNEWLVAEIYEKYKSDKNSVDKKWWEIFEQLRGSDDGVRSAKPADNGASRPAADRPAPQTTKPAGQRRAQEARAATPPPCPPGRKPAEKPKVKLPTRSVRARRAQASAADAPVAEDKVDITRGPARRSPEHGPVA